MNNQSGNALLYVLVAIVLFAGLSFSMMKMNDGGDTSELDVSKVVFNTNEVLVYTSQVIKIIQQMSISGTHIENIDFVEKNEVGYDISPHYNKIYHIAGGGLIKKKLPEYLKEEVTLIPAAGWYLGRFNNVEWTPTAQNDILLVAYQIKRELCESLNKKITGDKAIPALSSDPSKILLGEGIAFDFLITDCPECEGRSMLCVSDKSLTSWSFYSIVSPQ